MPKIGLLAEGVFWKGSAYLEGAYYCQGGFTMEGAQRKGGFTV